jgi:hypothetical protein
MRTACCQPHQYYFIVAIELLCVKRGILCSPSCPEGMLCRQRDPTTNNIVNVVGFCYTRDMRKIPVTNSEPAIVDDCDYPLLSRFTWHVSKGYPAVHLSTTVVGQKVSVQMHRLVLPPKGGFVVDHINRNPLDNRRENLRHVHHSANAMNRGTNGNNTSGYRGISWSKTEHRWLVQATTRPGYRKCFGRYKTLVEAVAAQKAFGLYQS